MCIKKHLISHYFLISNQSLGNSLCVYRPLIQRELQTWWDNMFWFSFSFSPDHRHTFHHTHHPLSTHLPLPQRLRKRVHSMDRRRKKKRKKKKTSLPPSDVTPTIHEVDEEEAQSDTDGQGVATTPTEPPELQPQVKWDFLGFCAARKVNRDYCATDHGCCACPLFPPSMIFLFLSV